MKLNTHDIRAAVFVLRRYQQSGQMVPPSVAALACKLETAVRFGQASPWRQSEAPEDSHLSHVEFIGTKMAAQILGWSVRRVQRHSADLDGRRLGDRLVFPADSVKAYRDALADKDDP